MWSSAIRRKGCDAEAKVSTLAEAAEWLRGKALMHYPHSEFSRKYPAFDQPPFL